MADEMSEALQAMEVNEPQANLYRAAEEYVSDQAYELMGIGDDDDFNKLTELIKQAVLYGAHWNEQQIMKGAVEKRIETNFLRAYLCLYVDELGFEPGDKVKVIIFKED